MLLEDYIENLHQFYTTHGNLPVTDRAGHELNAPVPVLVNNAGLVTVTIQQANQ